MEMQLYQPIESSRDIKMFRFKSYSMMIIPSLQDDLFHVIVEKEGEGVSINCLLTKEGIFNAYCIEL